MLLYLPLLLDQPTLAPCAEVDLFWCVVHSCIF